MHEITIRRERRGLGFPEAAALIRRAVKAALRAQGVREDCLVNVLLTDDAGIRAINLDQRGVDGPTDVLSFPMNELAEGAFDPAACERDPESGRVLLGDMVLDLPRCAQQAASFGHGFDREVSYLAVHSLLHLLGYDHLDEERRKRAMRAREKAIMAALAL